MRIVNLTTHDVVVYDGPNPILRFPVTGTFARLAEQATSKSPVQVEEQTVPVEQVAYLPSVVGLPEPQPDVGYLVSRVLAAEVRRPDLYFPAEEVRDGQGRIIGCRKFGQFGARDAQ